MNNHPHVTVINMRSELTVDQCDQFRERALQQLDGSTRHLVLNMAALETIDSRGLETLLDVRDACAAQSGQLRLAACQEHIAKILEITRLPHELPMTPDIDSALHELAA